jgi:hypothetical protein
MDSDTWRGEFLTEQHRLPHIQAPVGWTHLNVSANPKDSMLSVWGGFFSRTSQTSRKISAATIIFQLPVDHGANHVPDDKIKWEDARPKALCDWLDKEFGASSSSRQAELWSMVRGVKVNEEEDPNTGLTSIRSTLSDLGCSVPAETTVSQFIERMSVRSQSF